MLRKVDSVLMVSNEFILSHLSRSPTISKLKVIKINFYDFSRVYQTKTTETLCEPKELLRRPRKIAKPSECYQPNQPQDLPTKPKSIFQSLLSPLSDNF